MRGHAVLMSLLKDRDDIEVIWRPCESHPRPERYGPHSDLCIRGMFYAQEHGADIDSWHETVYKAIHKHGLDVEDIDTFAQCCAAITDAKGLAKSLKNGEYKEELQAANDYAYDKTGVWVVPSYRMDGKKLDVKEDVGVTRDMLKAFLDNN